MGTHAGENLLNCRVCGERFSWTLCLDAHIRTHRGEKLVTGCSPHTMSTRLSPWPVNLNRLDPARFDCVVQCAVICIQCGSWFLQCCYWKDHMGTHTGENLMNCNVCGAGFSQAIHLDAHIQTHWQCVTLWVKSQLQGRPPPLIFLRTISCVMCPKCLLSAGDSKMILYLSRIPWSFQECYVKTVDYDFLQMETWNYMSENIPEKIYRVFFVTGSPLISLITKSL